MTGNPTFLAALSGALIDAASDGLVAVDGQLRIVVFNRAAGKIFGLDPEQMEGEEMTRLIPPGAPVPNLDHLEAYFGGAEDSTLGGELRVDGWHSSGRVVPISIQLHAANIHGQRLALASVRDISATIRAEQRQLQLTEQLSQAAKMEALVTMAAGITHDFNKCLGAVETLANTLMGEMGSEASKSRRLRQIQQAVLRAGHLTDQLLNFCSPSAGEMEVISINKVVKDVVSLLRSVFPSEIRIRTITEAGAYVKGDSSALTSALMNIGFNARDAMPDGGELVFTTRNMKLGRDASKITGVQPGDYRVLAVHDTGGGIPSEVLSRIFDPFFSTKERERGMGLGLATVYATIEAHGGKIIPVSHQGKGTEFTIFLPACPQVPRGDHLTPVGVQLPAQLGAGETILVVEDDEALREMTAYMLKKLGFSVLSAASGEQALDLFRRRHAEVDLVLLDVVLGDVTGDEVMRNMQELSPEVKVLVTSGFRKEDEPRQLLDAGALGFLKKPFGVQELRRMVGEALGK